MKKNKRQKLFSILSLIIISSILLYGFITGGITDTEKIQTQKSFTTSEFINQLNNKQKKLYNFIEKAIEINGEIKEITYQDHKYSLILKGKNENTYIICEMQANQSKQVLDLKVGDIVNLKGILKGFLMDIILLNCIIVD